MSQRSFSSVPSWQQALLPPLLLCAAALWLRWSGADDRIALAVYDSTLGHFPAREMRWLELFGHRLAKSAMLATWLLLLASACASLRVAALRPLRSLLWASVAAMAAGPMLVVLLKQLNGIHCPWDLLRYGGLSTDQGAWFVPSAEVTRCFPSGHAAGGFSPFAFYFAGHAGGRPQLRRLGLTAALLCGLLFSTVRVLQGAHFPSHNLWSAAIDWLAAAACFSAAAHRQGLSQNKVSSMEAH